MTHKPLNSWRELTQLGYFEPLPDGRLKLVVDGVDGVIDFHTHLSSVFYLARPPALDRKTRETLHHFSTRCKVNLDIYSGQNLHDERPSFWIWDFIPCIFSPIRYGKIQTHTAPNLLWEMDPLRIEKSVLLAIDRLTKFSTNSIRYSRVLADQPRLVFFCSVHPRDPRAEEKINLYIKAGARGMKVHPEVQSEAVDSPATIEHMKLWTRLSGGLPVIFHSGFNGYEPKRQRELADIKLYYPAVEALEGCPTVLGHAAMNDYPEAVKIARKFPYVSLEAGGQPPHHLEDMLDKLGDDRILYGSDWPFYPQALPIGKMLLGTEHTPKSRPKLFRENALRILKEK